MSDSSLGGSSADNGAWSLNTLADIHGGVFADDPSMPGRPELDTDPDAARVFRALDHVVQQLSGLPAALPMPAQYADRIGRAVATVGAASAAGLIPAPRTPDENAGALVID